MCIVIPVLALEAPDHATLHRIIWLLAIAIFVEEVLVVLVLYVLMIFLILIQLACLRHSTVPTVTSKVQALA